MGAELSIVVSQGHHTMPVPRGLVRLVEDEMRARGIAGEYKLWFGPPERGTPHTPRFKARPNIGPRGLELVLKPGGNDSAHTCWLQRANSAGMSDHDLWLKL